MKLFLSILFTTCLLSLSKSQSPYQPSPENLAARKWFDSARFGMFIHWGAFSVPGSGEWVMNDRNITVTEYSSLLTIFNPVRFDAKKWVSAARRAGMQYITLITRHHDGFSDWDTKQSEWKITNTDWKQDAVKLIAEECQRQGIRLFVYYSLLDWYRSDYQYETGRTGHGTGRTAKSDWNHYIAFMKAQLTELLTQYGPIAGVWFDGYWDQLSNDRDKINQPKVDWHLPEIYALIHQLQPQCLIGNNHHLSPIPGEDFQMFEKDLPGGNSTGFGGQSVSSLPLETCETINDSWGFNITDTRYKSSKELIHLLVKDAGYGANLLLNIGPLPNGEIQTAFTERLDSVGSWLKKNGFSIYGTRAGYLKPQDWGAITEKGDMVYLHIFKSDGEKFFVKIPYKVKTAEMDGTPLKVQVLGENYIMIDLKGIPMDPVDAIIKLVVIK
ncbi:MAG TPA: alpha-L-fucosidase [Puia sp.]|jgi:alpha-L-fucosidase|nr:alpha-L-fucosidase [Puia sp.]